MPVSSRCPDKRSIPIDDPFPRLTVTKSDDPLTASQLPVSSHISFPNSTNLWQPNAARDPATDTLADAAIWESRSFFYRAQAHTRIRSAKVTRLWW